MKDPKAKAFFLAFQALFSIDDGDDEDDKETHKDQTKVDVDEGLHGFLSMVGYINE
jgi:hypothetical protein